jgi:hypothetical protein
VTYLLAAWLLVTAPTPTPQATPAPSAPPIVWGGVTLGESGNAIVQRLGKPDVVDPSKEYAWYYDHLVPGARLQLHVSGKGVTRIALVYQSGADIRDRYGVLLGGTVEDLLSQRGTPTHKNCYGWLVYEIDTNSGWFYQTELKRNIVDGIGVGRLSEIYCPTEPL